MRTVTVKEPEHLVEMYAIAARHAAVSGVRQQIRYGKFAGRLGPCSSDFDGDSAAARSRGKAGPGLPRTASMTSGLAGR